MWINKICWKTWVRTGNRSRETFRIKKPKNGRKMTFSEAYAKLTRSLRLVYDSTAGPTPRTFQLWRYKKRAWNIGHGDVARNNREHKRHKKISPDEPDEPDKEIKPQNTQKCAEIYNGSREVQEKSFCVFSRFLWFKRKKQQITLMSLMIRVIHAVRCRQAWPWGRRWQGNADSCTRRIRRSGTWGIRHLMSFIIERLERLERMERKERIFRAINNQQSGTCFSLMSLRIINNQ